MHVRIRGCRGSLASPGKSTKRYGGNTSCVELRTASGGVVILDAGTGIRELGAQLVQERVTKIDLLLTHLHVDHIEGLGMFAPIYDSETELHIWGPASPVASLSDRIATYFSPPLFPLHLSEVAAEIIYHDASEAEWTADGMRFVSHAIVHPGPTVGYRIEEGDVALAYLTDHEPALGVDLEQASPEWISGYAIAHRADLLIHDCQYTQSEYADRIGWGHTSTAQMAAFAAKAGVDRLLLYHHDPMHTDDQLELMRDEVRERWDVDGQRCDLASEDTEFEL